MTERRGKTSKTPSLPATDSSDLGDSPLVPLRSFIPTHQDDLEGFQIEDKTLLDPRSSVQSDSSLSYPSNEPSLLEQLRSGLAQGGTDVRKILNLKRSHKDMTINFSVTSSPGSLNSTADFTLPPERRRQVNGLKRKTKANMTLNFTLNDTASSSDNQENESPMLPKVQTKALFKKPSAKNMSIRIDEVSDSDTSKVSNHDDSLPALDSKSRNLPLRSSRSRAARDRNMTFEISLDSSAGSEVSKGQAHVNDLEGSSNVSGVNGENGYDVSVTPTSTNSGNEPMQINDQTFTCDAKDGGNINLVQDMSPGLPVNSSNRSTDDETDGLELDGTRALEFNEKPSADSITANDAPFNHTFVVEPEKPQEPACPALQDTPKSSESSVEGDNIASNTKCPDASAPAASLTTPTRGTTASPKMSARSLSKEVAFDNTPFPSEKTGPESEVHETSPVALLDGKTPSKPEESLTGPSCESASSKLGEERTNLQHSNKLTRKKNKFSVNFTLSDSPPNDSSVRTPTIFGRNEKPLLRKRSNYISVALQPDDDGTMDDTSSNTSHAVGQEGKCSVDEENEVERDFSPLGTGVSSPSYIRGVNGSNRSLPTISGKLVNPLKKSVRSNKVSVPYTFDDSVRDCPTILSTEAERQVVEAQSPDTCNSDHPPPLSTNDEEIARDEGSSYPVGKSVDEANGGDNACFLSPSDECTNPSKERRLEQNLIPRKPEDTSNDVEWSDISKCNFNAGEHPMNQRTAENVSVLSKNHEDLLEGAPNETQSSVVLSLGCSLDDMPRSSSDYDSDLLKSSQKISVLPHETSNVAKERSPSVDGHSDVACSPESCQSLDNLHLELSLNGSLQYSGVDSDTSCMKPYGKGETLVITSSGVDGAEAKDVNRSVSTQGSQDSPVLMAKDPPLLRRSKRGSKSVIVESDLSGSKECMAGDVYRLTRKSYKNPLKTKSRLNKVSIAFDETNEADTTASGGSLTQAQKSSTPQTIQLPVSSEVEVTDVVIDEVLLEGAQDKNGLRINNACPEVKSTGENNVSNVDNVGTSSKTIATVSEQYVDGLIVQDVAKSEVVATTLEVGAPQTTKARRSTSPKTSDTRNETRSRPPASSNGGVNEGIQRAVVTPKYVPCGLADPNVEQLRSSLEEPLSAHCNIREPSPCITPAVILDDQELLPLEASPIVGILNQLTVVSPGVPSSIDPEPVDDNVAPLPPKGPSSHHSTISHPPTTQTMQTTASSLHLHLTTLDTEVGDATNIKSHCTVSRLSPVHEALFRNDEPPEDVKKAIEEAKIGSTCRPSKGIASQDVERLSNQASLNSELQRTVKQNSFANSSAPKPSDENMEQIPPVEQRNEVEPPAPDNFIAIADPSGIPGKEDPPEAKVPRQSKRKSVSFKPPTENVYHSPPYHGSPQLEDQQQVGRTQVDNGYEFSRIQMTTDISEIQPSPRYKKTKRHFSSTPISKPKKAKSPSKPGDIMLTLPQPVTNAQLTNHQFLVPSVIPVAKRVSIHPVPEFITPSRPDVQSEPGPRTDDIQGSSEGGSGTSSYDLSCENSLEISAIPKESTAPKWGNLFHSTPLHRTKASMKRLRKKPQEPPAVSQAGEPIPAEQPEATVQTSRNLRSRSKASLENGSASEPSSQLASVKRSLRSSSRINQTPAAAVVQTFKSIGDEPDDGPVNGSPASRISIQDNTIVSTRIESQSRTRGSKTRSNTGSAFKSYDSHRKMTSRRLFDEAEENDSNKTADAGYPREGAENPREGAESSLPTSAGVPLTPNAVLSTSHQGDILSSPAETSIARSYEPSIPPTDENVTVICGQQEDYSDNESIDSSASAGSSNSVPSHVILRQSFESQLSSLGYRSGRHTREKGGSHRRDAEAPKPRSKFAVSRPDPNAGLNHIYPADAPVKKRKRTLSTAVNLFNPGTKWKKSKQLYAWLKKKLEPTYKLRTNLESERLIIDLEHARVMVSHGHMHGALDSAVERMARLQICADQLQLWAFFMKFMPFEFVRDVVPMGGAFGKPFDLST